MSDWFDFVEDSHTFGPDYDPQRVTVHAYNVDGGTFCDISVHSMGGSSSVQLMVDDMTWLRDTLTRALQIDAGDCPMPTPPAHATTTEG